MTVKEILAQLESLGSEKLRAHNRKYGVGENQYGVKMGDIRNLAKPLKTNHPLAMELWETGNMEARLLAILIMDPEQLTNQKLDELVRSETSPHVADWLAAYVIKAYPDRETLRLEWMQS
ncbi:MAG TPA: DNA alkylation repair protein, partial [Saprospiraceae bacterium]|nr:DNA alkylation repair protein [Saprospiraceae bacterium]